MTPGHSHSLDAKQFMAYMHRHVNAMGESVELLSTHCVTASIHDVKSSMRMFSLACGGGLTCM